MLHASDLCQAMMAIRGHLSVSVVTNAPFLQTMRLMRIQVHGSGMTRQALRGGHWHPQALLMHALLATH